jgi:hypothetical protein
MKASLPTLKSLLLNNVAEIKFLRRRPKPGSSPRRRMLCTNSLALLNSTEGRLALNYRRAINMPKFDPNAKNLVITWDIFMQDYRCINVAACDIIQVIPANKEFWEFFNEKLAGMNATQKINFMNT